MSRQKLRVIALLLALFSLVAAPARAQDASGKAAVTIAMSGDELLVTIALDRPVTRLEMEQADVVRESAIVPVSPGLTLADNALSSAVPFDTAVFRLVEDLTERDAKYPVYYRIGEGRLVYMRAAYPDQTAWDTSLAIEGMPEGWTRWPDAGLPLGYLFVGPQSMIVHEGGVQFVFDGNGDEAFEAGLRGNVSRALDHLVETFGSPPVAPPFVAASIIPADRISYTGDVTDSAMIALRFMTPVKAGSDAKPTLDDALGTVRSVVLHEGVHFWNGGRAHFRQGTPQWLHEGGAEYLAALGALKLGWAERSDLQASIGQWFDRCATSLAYSDEAALNDLEFLNASIRYSCGPLLHVLAELYLAEAGAGQSVTAGWRDTVRAAEQGDGTYGLPEFVAALGQDDLLAKPALAAILTTSGKERWGGVADELRRLGVGLELETSPPLRARTALMHLVRLQCTGLQPGEGYGFYSGARSYTLDTPKGCGVLAGNPEIETLGGSSITDLTAADYERVQALCAVGKDVAFGIAGGAQLAVPCTAPLPPAATKPKVTSLPDLPAFEVSTP